jgi:hypothetical protein
LTTDINILQLSKEEDDAFKSIWEFVWRRLYFFLKLKWTWEGLVFEGTQCNFPRAGSASLPIHSVCDISTKSESQSYFTTGGLTPVSSSWRQAPWDPWPVFFQLNTCGYSPYVTSSLTRGWFCHLHLLLVLASVVILRS